MENVNQRFFRVPELANVFRCSRAKAYVIVKNLGIRTVNIDGITLVPIEEIDRVTSEAKARAEQER
jgi:hypothetical protein